MDVEIGEWTQGTLPWNVKTFWDSGRGIIRARACRASRLLTQDTHAVGGAKYLFQQQGDPNLLAVGTGTETVSVDIVGR